MLFFYKLLMATALCCFLTRCANDGDAAGTRHEKIAGAYCECTTRLAELNKKAQASSSASDSTSRSNFSQMLNEIQVEYEKSRECAATIIGQYGKLNAEDLALVEQALAARCAGRPEQKSLLYELLGE
jgi:hypothetical protein